MLNKLNYFEFVSLVQNCLNVLLAIIPPTLAAASIIRSGLFFLIKLNVLLREDQDLFELL